MQKCVCFSPLHVAVLTSQAVSPAEPGRMRFSHDLIIFSGADSLHMIYSAELFAVLIRIKAVLITLSVVAGIPQGLYRGRMCECALRMRECVFRLI